MGGNGEGTPTINSPNTSTAESLAPNAAGDERQVRSRLPSARAEANSAQEEADHKRPKRPSLIVGQTYWLQYHRPGQAGHGKLYAATCQGADCGVGSWAWLDQSESEKVTRKPLAQLPVLHLLSAEELQAARQAPELHRGDLQARGPGNSGRSRRRAPQEGGRQRRSARRASTVISMTS